MRTLRTKGIDAMPDKLGFWTYYRDWVQLSKEEASKLTWDEVAEATAPRTPEEWRDYYYEQQAEYDLEEYYLSQYDD